MTDSDAPGDAADPILNPGSSAVVAFTLVGVVLLGNNLLVQGTQSLFGLFFTGAYDKVTFFVTWLFGALVPALAALALAWRAQADASALRWERTLAQAAFLLGLLAIVYTAALMLGGLIHEPF